MALLAAVIVPIVGLVAVLLVTPDGLPSLTPAPAAVTMPVTSGAENQAQAVQATLGWQTGSSLLAPGWSGIVTSVDVAPGSVIHSGTIVGAVDGVSRIALASPTPFYRTLGPGASGPDVVALRSSLAGLNVGAVGAGKTFDATLGSAVRQLDTRLTGAAQPASTDVFDPSWVIYLPSASFSVGSVAMVVGATAPAMGQPIVTAAPQLQPFTLASDSDANGNPGPALPSSASGYELELNGTAIALADTFSVTAPASLAQVAQSVGPGATSLSGVVELAQPVTAPSVPSSAVVTDADGQMCVFTREGGRLVPISVQVVGGQPGTTALASLPASLQRVITNPGQVAAGRSCR